MAGSDADPALALGNLVQEVLLPRQRISLQNIDHETNGISRIGADEVDVGVSVWDIRHLKNLSFLERVGQRRTAAVLLGEKPSPASHALDRV